MFSSLRCKFSSFLAANHCLGTRSTLRTKVTSSFVNALQSIVGETNVTENHSVLKNHGVDEGHFPCSPPDVVVWPFSTKQVSQIVKLCDREEVAVIPFGTGTGLEGGIAALNGGVCLDFSKMNNILEVNAEDFDCRVEPGVHWRQLNAYLHDTGLWFTVDPGASASIGGMAATSASGTNAVRYGTMRENVLNLEVVLPNGDIINTSGITTRSRKSVAGYNLTNLFVGSEGTLGVITGITLKLYPIPEAFLAIVCSFPSVNAATDTTIQTLQCTVPVTKIELLDELAMKASHKYHKNDLPVSPTLFVEFNGSKNDIENQAKLFKEIAAANGCNYLKSTATIEERNQLWKARHEMFYACLALQPDCRILTTDVCVPISKLTDIIPWAQQTLSKMNILGPIVGHVGDGNFHILALLPCEDDTHKVERFAHQLAERAMSLGGTCTGEHGVGIGKKKLLTKQFNSETIAAMKTLKQAIDPKNIMNPGKVLD